MVQQQTIRPNGYGTYASIEYPTYAYYPYHHWEIVSNQSWEGPSFPVHTEQTSYRLDTYSLPTPTRLGYVTNVHIWITCRGRPNPSYFKTAIYNGSSLVYGSEQYQGATWTSYHTDYAVNPWTGLNWTWDQLDSLQAGVALKAGSGTYSECAEVWVVIDSVIPAGGAQIIGLEV